MKVHIGPYKNWFGPYQLAEALLFWIPKEPDEYGMLHTAKRVHNFGEWLAHGSVEPEPEVGEVSKWGEDRPITWLYKLLKWVDSKRKRKIKIHIDRYDTWSMDDTLAHIILPMLKQLKDNKHGSPFVDDEDVPEHIRRTQSITVENKWDVDTNHEARWDYVLDEMIFAFENKVNGDWEFKFTTGEYDYQSVKQENGHYLMVQGPNHTAETDWDAQKAYAKRIQNGFRLFGTYYEGLWD
jgi:hypothetical protein